MICILIPLREIQIHPALQEITSEDTTTYVRQSSYAMQPVKVRPTFNGDDLNIQFELVAGARRYRAWQEVYPNQPIPCQVVTSLD